MTLLPNERYILHWLSQYGALPKSQIIRLLYDQPPNSAERTIQRLKKNCYLTDVGGYYLGLDEVCKPDQRLITAVWVLLRFIQHVHPMAHSPATFPSQLFFLKENVGYEIVVLYEGESHLTRLLQVQEDLKYIIVLPNVEMARRLVLPKVPCLFATVDYDGQEEPNITFYTEEVTKYGST